MSSKHKHERALREVALNTHERPQPIAPTGAARLISRAELLDRIPVTYATIWKMMRSGAFPRSRVVGDRTVWLEREIDDWNNALPNRPLKGDNETAAAL